MQTIVVTGGAGFVGSHLAIAWKRADPAVQVVAIDNLKRRGSELQLPRLRESGVEFVHGDIRNAEDLASVTRCDLLIECSAEPSVLAGLDGQTGYLIHTNLLGTINCLELVRRTGAMMVFLSTSRVYPYRALAALPTRETATRLEWDFSAPVPGVTARGVTEQYPLDGARSLYGATKLASELLIAEYVDSFGVRAVINRCGLLAGPWQMGKIDQGVIALWVARHLWGDALTYIGYGGTGKQVRDVLHIDDLSTLVRQQVAQIERHSGRTYNVGGGFERSVSLCELTTLCQHATSRTIPIHSQAAVRPVDLPMYVTDTTCVEHATDWRATQSVATVVADVTRWMRAHEALLKPIFMS